MPTPVTVTPFSTAPHLVHLLSCNDKTTNQGPLSVSWQQLYELRGRRKDRESESACVSEREEQRAYSAEIRWYSPFVQNEFIRGVRDSQCRESRFLCDNGQEPQTEGEKKSLISCFSEEPQYQAIR